MKITMGLLLSYLNCGKIFESLNTLHYTIFSKKKDYPKIKSLLLLMTRQESMWDVPVFVLICRPAEHAEQPPVTNPSLFGFKIEADIPVPFHGNAEIALGTLLQLVACGYKSDAPCSRASCSCREAKPSHTGTSYCNGMNSWKQCANDKTRKMRTMWTRRNGTR